MLVLLTGCSCLSKDEYTSPKLEKRFQMIEPIKWHKYTEPYVKKKR